MRRPERTRSVMGRPVRTRSVRRPKGKRQAAPGSGRDRLALLLALVTILCLDAIFFFSSDTQFRQFLMPGPLTSAHGSIENCSACHTNSGTGKLSWVHGLSTSDPLADSKACLTCHKMPNTALFAHGTSAEVLEQSTKRSTRLAAMTPVPPSARLQSIAFPTDDKVERGIYCATCHQEHQGANFKLNKISNEQCRSCHVLKFDSFDGHHPEFENYPFERRTRIVYDHAGHFGKHFPEVAKKDPTKRIPATCSACHNPREDRRAMAVAPFEQTCFGCHFDQVIGKERVSGPKGIAFLALPGLDLQTLKKKKASIGEWPDESEAGLTPFMKVMIGRNERGRALIRIVDSLNLQDLSGASDNQIRAVTDLVWEIKRLFYALIKGKASDVLADLNIGGGAKLSTNLIADLTASIPRDVVISAHQQWLPNLGTEMESRLADESKTASRPNTYELAQANQQTVIQQTVIRRTPIKGAPGAGAAKTTSPQTASPQTAPPQTAPPQPEGAARRADTANASSSNKTPSADERPRAKAADQTDDLLNPTEEELRRGAAPVKGGEKAAPPERTARRNDAASKADTNAPADAPAAAPGAVAAKAATSQPEAPARRSNPASANSNNRAPSGNERPRAKAADQTDDLLNPTEEELRGTAAPGKGAPKAVPPERAARPERAAPPERAERAAPKTETANAKPDRAVSADAAPKAGADVPADDAPAASETAAATPQTRAATVLSIESDVDSENWAEYGGWYRQDYAIFYRPTGHKDKFIYSWLLLTGPQAPKGDRGPAAAVFDLLTDKDAQGSCTKCHSVDEIRGSGRLVNFSPVKNKQGRFTNFMHEPHFGILENRGCLTCHGLEKDRPYLKSYEQGNPRNFVSNFGGVKKELCQSCHTSSMARQDCLLCHKYHVNGVVTPVINTRIPTE
jgi:hypothetical protein